MFLSIEQIIYHKYTTHQYHVLVDMSTIKSILDNLTIQLLTLHQLTPVFDDVEGVAVEADNDFTK